MQKTKISPFRQKQTDNLRFKSVPNSSTQYTSLCGSGKETESPFHKNVMYHLSRKDIPIDLKALIELMYFNALRISEVLNIAPYDIDNLGRITIKGSKNSHNKIVISPSHTDFFIRCKQLNTYPFSIYDRFFIYRLFKKLGIYKSFDSYSKKAVTHSLRFESIGNLQAGTITKEERARFVGHKNIKNTEHYEQKNRKSSN